MGGFHGSSESMQYCPYCKEDTEQTTEWMDDEQGIICNECENELQDLVKVSLDVPFLIGEDIYVIKQGSDDEWRLEEYNDK